MLTPYPAIETSPLIAAAYVHWLIQETGLDKDFPGLSAQARHDGSPYTLAEVVPLLDACVQQSDGLALGLRCPLATHGSLGFAVLTGSSVWNSVQVLCEHFSVRAQLFSLVCKRNSDYGMVELVRQCDLGRHGLYIGNVALTTVLQLLQSLLPHSPQGSGIVHLPQPPDVATHAMLEREGWTIETGQPRFALSIRHEHLDRAPPNNTAELHSILLRACKDDQSAWQTRFASKVSAFVNTRIPDWPDLSLTARHFAMSRSTLVRRLSNEGATYGGLLAALKLQFIDWNLANSDKPLQEISSMAGFSDQASFSRFFKANRGVSPLEFRNRERVKHRKP